MGVFFLNMKKPIDSRPLSHMRRLIVVFVCVFRGLVGSKYGPLNTQETSFSIEYLVYPMQLYYKQIRFHLLFFSRHKPIFFFSFTRTPT